MSTSRRDRRKDRRTRKNKAGGKSAAVRCADPEVDMETFDWEALLPDIPDGIDEDDASFSWALSLPTMLGRLADVPVDELYRLIIQARQERYIPVQHEVIRATLHRMCGFPPHEEQIRVLRRLIFGKGDTLLIAKTGWGKSVIFQAFSVLTRNITIQIIPLIKLGDEQAATIEAIPGTKVCLITSDTRREDQDMFKRIEEGYYTHILLGPEQASQPAFRTIIKKPEMQSKIGLVAIDECHVIKQWESFRPEFTMLDELRIILRRDVVWFGCSATIDKKTEHVVLNRAGFRRVGNRPYQTEVIRTSINRDDISICVRPLPRLKTTSPETLFFAIEDAFQYQEATPLRIKKTVIFIDSKAEIQEVTQYLRMMLVLQSRDLAPEDQYFHGSPCGRFREKCVEDVIQVYTSSISTYDQDRRYNEFRTEASSIRIMVATTSLGMGVNIPDIARVILWRFPIDCDIGDVQQRIGRGGRGPGRTSEAYILVPYWTFDSEGFEAEDETPPQPEAVTIPPSTPRPRLANGRIKKSYSSASVQTPLASQAQLHSLPPSSQASQTPRPRRSQAGEDQLKPWNQQELQSREGILASFLEMINSPCHRDVILRELGEFRLPASIERPTVPKERCCSGCNPSLFPEFPLPPVTDQEVRKPQKGTRDALALKMVDTWAVEQMESIYDHPGRRFLFTPDAFLETGLRWRVAQVFAKTDWWRQDVLEILENADIRPWGVTYSSDPDFVAVLESWVPKVEQQYKEEKQEQRELRKTKKAAKLLESLATGQIPDEPSPLTGRRSTDLASLTQEDIMRDSALVREAVSRSIVKNGGHPLRQVFTPLRSKPVRVGTPVPSLGTALRPTPSPLTVRSTPRKIMSSPVFARVRAQCAERDALKEPGAAMERFVRPGEINPSAQVQMAQEEQPVSISQLERSQEVSQEELRGADMAGSIEDVSSDDGLYIPESPVQNAARASSLSPAYETRSRRQNRQGQRETSSQLTLLQPRDVNRSGRIGSRGDVRKPQSRGKVNGRPSWWRRPSAPGRPSSSLELVAGGPLLPVSEVENFHVREGGRHPLFPDRIETFGRERYEQVLGGG